MSEKGQSMKTKLHMQYTWQNPLLKWEPSKYGGVKYIIVPETDIWTPTVQLFNEASLIEGESVRENNDKKVHIAFNGTNSLAFAQFFKSTCEINVSDFPFDEQCCEMIFGSWTQDKTLQTLSVKKNLVLNKRTYKSNGEWDLVVAEATADEVQYSIQKNSHSVIKIKFKIERKYFFFVMNLVIPCALIACMIFLVFVLPPKSGERISLGITVMLSMAIFQELSSQKLPSSSDNFPLLEQDYFWMIRGGSRTAAASKMECFVIIVHGFQPSTIITKCSILDVAAVLDPPLMIIDLHYYILISGIYYTTSMFEIGVAMAMNCFILNLYYRTYEMKPWVRRLVLDKLSKIVYVDVPANRTQKYLENMRKQSACHLTTLNETSTLATNNHADKVPDDDSGINVGGNEPYYANSKPTIQEEQQPIKKNRSGFRVRTFTYRSRHGKRDSNESDFIQHRFLTGQNSLTGMDDFSEKGDKKNLAEDWRMAARVLDRIMLTISVVTGVVSCLVIFLQAKRFREMFVP